MILLWFASFALGCRKYYQTWITTDFVATQNCTTGYISDKTGIRKAWCKDILTIFQNLHVVVNWDAKAYWDLITNESNYNSVGVGGGRALSTWASKVTADPWLAPCLEKGRQACLRRGVAVSGVRGSAWDSCLFETQLECYSQ